MIGKRQIEGALDVTPLPKRPMGPNEVAVILIPGDEAKESAELVNIPCPSRVVPFINSVVDESR